MRNLLFTTLAALGLGAAAVAPSTAEAGATIVVQAPVAPVALKVRGAHWEFNAALGRPVWVAAPPPRPAPPVWVPGHWVGKGKHARWVPGHYR
jgi:hypothetical protein